MANYFDRFDNQPSQPKQTNYFDRFDDKPTSAGESIRKGVNRFGRDLIGTPEALASMASGALAMVGGNIAGGIQAINNRVNTRLMPGGVYTNRDPSEIRNKIIDTFTYRPQTQGGQAVAAGLETLFSPVTALAQGAGQISKDLGGSQYIQDLTSDVAGALIPVAAVRGVQSGARGVQAARPVVAEAVQDLKAKAAPIVDEYKAAANLAFPDVVPTVNAIRSGAAKTGSAIARGADILTNPAFHTAAAAGNLAVGNIPGAAGHAGIALSRAALNKITGRETNFNPLSGVETSIQGLARKAVREGIDDILSANSNRVVTPNISAVKAAETGAPQSLSSKLSQMDDAAAVKAAKDAYDAQQKANTAQSLAAGAMNVPKRNAPPNAMGMMDEGEYKAPGMATVEDSMDALTRNLQHPGLDKAFETLNNLDQKLNNTKSWQSGKDRYTRLDSNSRVAAALEKQGTTYNKLKQTIDDYSKSQLLSALEKRPSTPDDLFAQLKKAPESEIEQIVKDNHLTHGIYSKPAEMIHREALAGTGWTPTDVKIYYIKTGRADMFGREFQELGLNPKEVTAKYKSNHSGTSYNSELAKLYREEAGRLKDAVKTNRYWNDNVRKAKTAEADDLIKKADELDNY